VAGTLPLASRRLFWEVAGTPFVESQRLRGVADVLIARDIAAAVADAAKQLHKLEGFDQDGWISVAAREEAGDADQIVGLYKTSTATTGQNRGASGGIDDKARGQALAG